MNYRITSVITGLLLIGAACRSEAREKYPANGTPPVVGERVPPVEVRIAGRSVADWTNLKKDEFVTAMDTQLVALDRRVDSARENVRAELQEKRQEIKRLNTEIKDAGADAWQTTRQKLLDAVRWVETKLEQG